MIAEMLVFVVALVLITAAFWMLVFDENVGAVGALGRVVVITLVGMVLVALTL